VEQQGKYVGVSIDGGCEMKFPESIQVGGYTVPVVWDNIFIKNRINGESQNSPFKLITIDESIARNMQNETFWHEVLHQINCIYLDGILEENHIDALGNGLYQVMKGIGVEFE